MGWEDGRWEGGSRVEGKDEGCFWKYSVIAYESLPIMGGIESSCGNAATFQPRTGLSTLPPNRTGDESRKYAHRQTHTDAQHSIFLRPSVLFPSLLSSDKTLALPRLAPRRRASVMELNEDCGKRKAVTQKTSSLQRNIPNLLVSSVSQSSRCWRTNAD